MPTSLSAILEKLVADGRALIDARSGEKPEAVLRRLIEPLAVAALVADNTGRYVASNPAASSLTGYSPSELLQLSVWQLTPNLLDHEAETLWRAFLAHGQQSGDYRLLVKGGRITIAEYAAQAHALPGLHVSLLRPIS